VTLLVVWGHWVGTHHFVPSTGEVLSERELSIDQKKGSYLLSDSLNTTSSYELQVMLISEQVSLPSLDGIIPGS